MSRTCEQAYTLIQQPGSQTVNNNHQRKVATGHSLASVASTQIFLCLDSEFKDFINLDDKLNVYSK